MADATADDTVLTAEIPEWKRREIAAFEELIEAHEAVGVVNVEGIASKQFQQVRKNLHGSAEVRVGRNTLMRRALEATGNGDLVEHVSGQSGLLVTDENPFSLYRKIEEGKSPAPIKVGQEAPHDIVVPEGDTGFDPGPFVGDLQQAGVSARIEDGAIRVVEDSVVLEEGEEATQDVAEILQKLDIQPIEVGLDLRALLQDGTVFDPETLDIDVEGYREDLEAAASGAFNLGVNAEVVNATTAGPLLSTASTDALALGVEAEVSEPDVVERLAGRADGQVRALAARLDDDALPEELRGAAEAAPEPDDGADEDEDATGEDGDDEEETDGEADEDTDDDDDEGDVGDAMDAVF